MTEYTGNYPCQCSCGHLFLEKYSFPKPTDEGNIGFCWCGFCRTKYMVKAIKQSEAKGVTCKTKE